MTDTKKVRGNTGLANVYKETTPAGTTRYRFRDTKKGYGSKNITLPDLNHPSFFEAYEQAKNWWKDSESQTVIEISRNASFVPKGTCSAESTVETLIEEYKSRSAIVKSWSESHRRNAFGVLRRFKDRQISTDGEGLAFGNLAIRQVSTSLIQEYLDHLKFSEKSYRKDGTVLKVGFPTAARNLKDRLSGVFEYAVDKKIIAAEKNPMLGVKLTKSKTSGHRIWTDEEVAQYFRTHHLGTIQHLYMTMLLNLAGRGGDMVKLGRKNIIEGRIVFTPEKTKRHDRPRVVNLNIEKPLHRALMASGGYDRETFVINSHGNAFASSKAMQNWFAKSVKKAGLGPMVCPDGITRNLTSHGMRHYVASRLAAHGGSSYDIEAVLAVTNKTAQIYAAKHNRVIASDRATSLLSKLQNPPVNDDFDTDKANGKNANSAHAK